MINDIRKIDIKKAGAISATMGIINIIIHILIITQIMSYTWVNGGRSVSFESARQTSLSIRIIFFRGVDLIQLCIILVFVLMGITVAHNIFCGLVYKTKPFSSNIFSSYSSKSEFQKISNKKEFLKSSSSITAKLIYSGELKTHLSTAINLKHPSCSGLKDKEVSVPIFAYLIHHEKFGYFLIDSGCDSSYINNPYGKMKVSLISKFVPKTILKPEDAIDIFGDQSFWSISTPGHTQGHTSYLVNTKEHPILIAGDACCISLSMEKGVGPSGSDTTLGQKSFERIMQFLKDTPQVKVWIGHEFLK